MELQCLSLKKRLALERMEKTSRNEGRQNEVQQKKDITADGQDYRSTSSMGGRN